MKVYVVERAYEYETSTIEKVFASREAADAFALARSVELGYGDCMDVSPMCVGEFDVDGVT